MLARIYEGSFWNSISRRKRKLAVWALGLLLLYTVVGFLILPPIIRSMAVKQISKQLDREVSIQKIKINPFALSTTIRGLLIQDKDGEPFVSWDEVYVNFQLSSFLGHPWVFKEISVTRPFARARMNKDGTFNFSDLVAKFSTNAAPARTASRPLALRVDRLHIGGATAAVADFTPREPFKRTIGPLDITLDNFRTDPDNKNPYSFTGTTDAGEQISWSGFFYLTPLRSQGELKLFNFTLNKYAPLYQDLVRFEIRDGSIALDAKYQFEMERDQSRGRRGRRGVRAARFQARRAGRQQQHRGAAALAVTGVSADLESRQAAVDSVLVGRREDFFEPRQGQFRQRGRTGQTGGVGDERAGRDFVPAPLGDQRRRDAAQSTNQWSGTIHSVAVTNCALHLEDDVNSRPAQTGFDGHRAGREKHFQRPRHESHGGTFPALEHERFHQDRDHRVVPAADGGHPA